MMELLKLVDLFQVDHSLLKKGKLQHGTSLSGLISLCLIICYSILFAYEALNIYKNTHIPNSCLLRNQSLEEINLNNHTTFAIQVNLGEENAEFVTLRMTSTLTGQNLTGNWSIPLVPCTIDLMIPPHRYHHDSYDSLIQTLGATNLNKWLCTNSTDLIVGGQSSNDNVLKSIRLSLLYNESDKTMEQLAKNKNQLIINTMFVNYYYAQESASIVPFIEKQRVTFNPINQQFNQTLYFKRIQRSYTPLYQYWAVQENAIAMESQDSILDKVLLNTGNSMPINSSVLGEITFQKSPYTLIYSQDNQNLVTVIASIGGQLYVSLLFWGFLLKRYNRNALIDSIAENCYQFTGYNDALALLKVKELREVDHFQGDVEENKRRRKQRRKCYFIMRLQCIKRAHRTQLLSIGREFVCGDLDIGRIVNLMHDVERLKTILFSKQQIEIFNHLPSPVVSLTPEMTTENNSKLYCAEIDPPLFEAMFENQAKQKLSNKIRPSKRRGNQNIELQRIIEQFQNNTKRLGQLDEIDRRFKLNMHQVLDKNTSNFIAKKEFLYSSESSMNPDYNGATGKTKAIKHRQYFNFKYDEHPRIQINETKNTIEYEIYNY